MKTTLKKWKENISKLTFFKGDESHLPYGEAFIFLLTLVLSIGIGLLLVFIGCMGLKNSGEEDYTIGRFIIPYIMGFVTAMGG